ncbi:MAG: hypothetical protein NC092_04085 [Butyrivibrio sp.]|nr:hypothetical protein [Butyrivibrio sp.]
MLDNFKHNRSITLNTLNDLYNMLNCDITDIIDIEVLTFTECYNSIIWAGYS